MREAACGPILDLAGEGQRARGSKRPQEDGTAEPRTAKSSLARALPPGRGGGTALPRLLGQMTDYVQGRAPAPEEQPSR